MKNIPKKIYLQIDEYANDADNFNDLAEVSWCKDRINKTDIVYYIKSNKEMCCPICKGSGEIDVPKFKHKALEEKRATAKMLKAKGYSIREIMKTMNYKSPRSVQNLLIF